jgi:hypothetical protein
MTNLNLSNSERIVYSCWELFRYHAYRKALVGCCLVWELSHISSYCAISGNSAIDFHRGVIFGSALMLNYVTFRRSLMDINTVSLLTSRPLNRFQQFITHTGNKVYNASFFLGMVSGELLIKRPPLITLWPSDILQECSEFRICLELSDSLMLDRHGSVLNI